MKLFQHQKDVLEQTEKFNRVAFYLDMGLGKTFVGSEKMNELNADRNLLICQKSKINDWINHFEEFYDYDVVKYESQSLEEIPHHSVIVVNYEKAWRRPQLKRLKNFTLMLDESSTIKNDKSQRSKFILGLNAENVILLSGTPTGGKYEELWSQLHLLGWKISKKTFLKIYTVQEWDDVMNTYKIVGYQNVERLKRKLAQFGAVFMKSDEVFDLPKQNPIYVKCATTKAYKDFQRDHYVKLDDEVFVGDTAATAKLYMRQLAGAFNKNKLQKVKDLIESTNDRLIIFYNFKSEYEALSEICEKLKRPVATMNGSLKNMKPYEEQSNSVSLIQYQAGAMGLNLQKANKIIYFTLTDKSELFEQSKKRIHRIGQDKPCFYYYLLTNGSVEWRMLDVLKQRKDFTDKLFEKEEM